MLNSHSKAQRRGWKMRIFTHAERLEAARICREYRDIWGLGRPEMAAQLSTTPEMVADVEGGLYPQGVSRIFAKLLVKNVHKKPRQVRGPK